MIRAKAFTMVEIMIVVTLLGILAAIVIPALASSTNTARETALASDINLLRRFVLIYAAQHQETEPGYLAGSLSEANLIEQATEATDSMGRTANRGGTDCNRGPYMGKIPKNPINGKSSIQILADSASFPEAGDNSHGWVYHAASGEIRVDSPGQDGAGHNYYDY